MIESVSGCRRCMSLPLDSAFGFSRNMDGIQCILSSLLFFVATNTIIATTTADLDVWFTNPASHIHSSTTLFYVCVKQVSPTDLLVCVLCVCVWLVWPAGLSVKQLLHPVLVNHNSIDWSYIHQHHVVERWTCVNGWPVEETGWPQVPEFRSNVTGSCDAKILELVRVEDPGISSTKPTDTSWSCDQRSHYSYPYPLFTGCTSRCE